MAQPPALLRETPQWSVLLRALSISRIEHFDGTGDVALTEPHFASVSTA
jgi:hypothetical protein